MKKLVTVVLAALVAATAFGREAGKTPKAKFEYLGAIYIGTPIVDGPFYSVDMSKSASFFYNFCELKVGLEPQNRWNFNAAIRYTYDNVALRRGVHLLENGGFIGSEILPDLKKSKINLQYMSLPIGISYSIGKVEIAANYSADFLLAARSKYKTNSGNKNKTDIYDGVSPIINTFEFLVRYRRYGILVNYALTPVFREGSYGDDAHVVSVGVYVNL